MDPKVVPLRPAPIEDGEARPKVFPRVISHPPGMERKELIDACVHQEELVLKYESRLTAFVAKILQDKLPSLEGWVAAVLATPPAVPGDFDETAAWGDVVEIAPRDQALDIAQPWPSIHRGISEPPLPERLDILVEAHAVVSLISLDVEPALPVTRKQAEAANLPAHLLFAKGEAFASVGEEPANEKTLLAAFEHHRKLLDESAEDLIDRLRTAPATPLVDCVGVVLALGPDGNAISIVTREKAQRLVADKPFLLRRLARKFKPGKLEGRSLVALPVVVWAKGHVSVMTREVVELE